MALLCDKIDAREFISETQNLTRNLKGFWGFGVNVLHALQKPRYNSNETNVLKIKLKSYPAVLTIYDKIVIPCNTKPKANKNAMTVKAPHTQNLCLLPLT